MTQHETAAALSEARLSTSAWLFLGLALLGAILGIEAIYNAMFVVCATICSVGSHIIRAILEQRHD